MKTAYCNDKTCKYSVKGICINRKCNEQVYKHPKEYIEKSKCEFHKPNK